MTREEAIKQLKSLRIHSQGRRLDRDIEALDMAINSLEIDERYELEYEDAKPKTDVLDKIRAEIDEQYDRVHPYNISCAEGLEMALEIIDKYKAE